MKPLVLGSDQVDRLAAVRHHAEHHPVTLDRLRALAMAGVSPAEDPRFRCEIPFGFRVAFTVEQHPAGWTRHLSVSIAEPGRLPNSTSLQWIGRVLGMRMDFFDADTSTYFENYPDGTPRAVNVVEPVRPVAVARAEGLGGDR